MIGNDIVDLKQDSTLLYWKRTRYLDKVFTSYEQSIITESENHHHMFWLLWSMKEAAYKCHVQNRGVRFFNPKKLRCKYDMSKGQGQVTIENQCYQTRTIQTDEYVYAEVTPDHGVVITDMLRHKKQSHRAQSSNLKQSVLTSISVLKQIPFQQLHIRTSKVGIPQVFHKSEKLPIQLSLTHCGRFSAYTFHENS